MGPGSAVKKGKGNQPSEEVMLQASRTHVAKLPSFSALIAQQEGDEND